MGLIFSLFVDQHEPFLFLSLNRLLEPLLGQWLYRFKTLDKQIKLYKVLQEGIGGHNLNFSRSDLGNKFQQFPESSLIVSLSFHFA